MYVCFQHKAKDCQAMLWNSSKATLAICKVEHLLHVHFLSTATSERLKNLFWKLLFSRFRKNREAWHRIAEYFEESWNFHNCLGAVDRQACPDWGSSPLGSVYYNYKAVNTVYYTL